MSAPASRRGGASGRGAAPRIVLASALVLLSGCFPFFGHTRTGALLEPERILAIRDGETTRRQVLESLGPPLAVLRRGEVARVPTVGIRRDGEVRLEASSAFEPFGASPGAGARDVVYLYERHEHLTKGFGLVVYPGAIVGSSWNEDRHDWLWVLVDGDTGVVRAHVHRMGGPPAAPPEPPEQARQRDPSQAPEQTGAWNGGRNP